MKSALHVAVTCFRLKQLPASLASLQQLRVLLANDNTLQQLPRTLGALCTACGVRLARPTLGRTPVAGATCRSGALPRLQHLDVSYNSLKELPPSFTQSPALAMLVANNNSLKKLPDQLGCVTTLQRIQLVRVLTELKRLSYAVPHPC